MILPIFWFIFGTILGSFLNVLAARYAPDSRIFQISRLSGRSKCLACGTMLKWFELIPLISFFMLRARCRTCKKPISFQYPIVEFAAGAFLAIIPMRIPGIVNEFSFTEPISGFWVWSLITILILAALTLIFLSAVDARLSIIPDQSNLLIAFLGICVTIILYREGWFHDFSGSFLGHYALLFGVRENIFLNRGIAFGAMLVFFGAIILFTRGKGMGMGDLKLALAGALLIGFPDIIIAIALGFILGSIFSILLIARQKKTMKSMVPFGPFIALGMLLVMVLGEEIMHGYFALFP